MTRIHNCTPHVISLFNTVGVLKVQDIPPCGYVARIDMEAHKLLTHRHELFEGCVITRIAPAAGAAEKLNAELLGLITDPYVGVRRGDRILVSSMCLQYIDRGLRGQVLSPDTGPESVVRDGEGRIIGVRRLLSALQEEDMAYHQANHP